MRPLFFRSNYGEPKMQILNPKQCYLPREMILKFLEAYPLAKNLDEPQFDSFFPPGLQRADYLLFSDQVICEHKGVRDFDVGRRAEVVHQKGKLTQHGFKRAMYNTINLSLREAGNQVRDTRKAFNIPEALGLVILENLVPANLSVMTLIDAADRKMVKGGLAGVDCVLCSDTINVFFDPNGKPITVAQTIAQKTTRAVRLFDFVEQLMRDWCVYEGAPFMPGNRLTAGDQRWTVDGAGRYERYDANFHFDEENIG